MAKYYKIYDTEKASFIRGVCAFTMQVHAYASFCNEYEATQFFEKRFAENFIKEYMTLWDESALEIREYEYFDNDYDGF